MNSVQVNSVQDDSAWTTRSWQQQHRHKVLVDSASRSVIIINLNANCFYLQSASQRGSPCCKTGLNRRCRQFNNIACKNRRIAAELKRNDNDSH
jgi:hypothetical protein